MGAGSGGPGVQSNHPLLHTQNEHVGRGYWEYDPNAGTPEQRAKVEELRRHFTANRHTQKHSSDELLRLQVADKLSRPRALPPAGPVPAQLDEQRVAEHLRGAISFYEGLQCEDGHWAGDYGGPMFLFPGAATAQPLLQLWQACNTCDTQLLQMLCVYVLGRPHHCTVHHQQPGQGVEPGTQAGVAALSAQSPEPGRRLGPAY